MNKAEVKRIYKIDAKLLNVQFEALFGTPFNVKFKGLFKLVCRIPPRKMKKPGGTIIKQDKEVRLKATTRAACIFCLVAKIFSKCIT